MNTNSHLIHGNGIAYANGNHSNGNGLNGATVLTVVPPILAPAFVPQRQTPQRFYDPNFVVTDEYRDSLPDLQNGPASLIQGSPVAIQQVGIHNFRLPLRYASRNGEPLTLETSVTGTVSLEAHKKGINMSRVMRTFYEHKDETFDLDMLETILQDYRTSLGSLDAYLILRFNYPMVNESLRSG
ncbi:MAG: GTP cyclohydrolase, FolE2/MptA family, partial [Caldilinea sp.]